MGITRSIDPVMDNQKETRMESEMEATICSTRGWNDQTITDHHINLLVEASCDNHGCCGQCHLNCCQKLNEV